MADAYSDAVRWLAGRELSVAELRARLADREHPPDEIAAAIDRLTADGSLDDERVARAYARTAIEVKGRGRLRIARELHQRGIARDVVSRAIADVSGQTDERRLVQRAIDRKLRGRRPADAAAYARLYQHLMRQGFSPAVVSAELRRLRGKGSEE